MSIPVSVNNGKATVRADMERPSTVKEADTPATAVAKAKSDLNSAIVQSSMNVAISSGNEPLALLYKAAINGINEELRPTLGEDAIQTAAGSQDNSAEATAARIVGMSTAFYDAYRQQNNLEDNDESREKFVEVIRGGFEKGFKEAQQVLEGLKVLKGDIAAGIDKTFELVMKGFDDFAAGPLSQPGAPMPAADPY
jgi:hypothetical protein